MHKHIFSYTIQVGTSVSIRWAELFVPKRGASNSIQFLFGIERLTRNTKRVVSETAMERGLALATNGFCDDENNPNIHNIYA